MSGLGPDVVSVVGPTVGVLLLQYSVVYTDESLTLFYLLFISQFVLLGDATSIFHAKQTSIYLDPHQKIRVMLVQLVKLVKA